MEAGTVNMDAYMEFVLNCGLIGREFTAKDARRIFVKVNIADELFVQVSSPRPPPRPPARRLTSRPLAQDDKNDSADGLIMDEFEECMVRICVELEDLGPDSAGDDEEGGTAVIDPAALAPKLLAFIEKCVVAHEANQSKKKKKKKPNEDGAKKKGRCARCTAFAALRQARA